MVKIKTEIKFSIITVCYNAEKVIKETIESVLNQEWENFEYIIVDGASTDKTNAFISEYVGKDHRIQWYSASDDGIFNAMNKGISYAKGDFLFFLNAGDVFHSKDVLVKVAEVAQEADIVIGDVAFKSEFGLREYSCLVGEELRNNLANGKCICHQVVFSSRKCLENGFDEQFSTCADYDWICRQVNMKKRIVKVDTIVADYDMSGVTHQVRYQKAHWKEYFQVIEKHFPQSKNKYTDEFKNLFIQERKERYQYKFMNQWLSLKQDGIDISSFFVSQGIHSLAIYGFHYMGQRLYDELKESHVKVLYAIDKNERDLRQQNVGLPIVHPNDMLREVDAIVITPIFDFLEVKEELLKKLNCAMFSIEDILYHEYK